MQGNATLPNGQTGTTPYKEDAFDQYLTFRALGGLLTSDEGKVTRMTQDDFCAAFGVNPSTIWRWKRNVPNLSKLIDERRQLIMPLSRVTTAWNQVYLLGMQTQDKRAAIEALKTFLAQFGDLQLPTQRVEAKVEINTWTGLMEAKRNVIEGEVVDGAATAAD